MTRQDLDEFLKIADRIDKEGLGARMLSGGKMGNRQVFLQNLQMFMVNAASKFDVITPEMGALMDMPQAMGFSRLPPQQIRMAITMFHLPKPEDDAAILAFTFHDTITSMKNNKRTTEYSDRLIAFYEDAGKSVIAAAGNQDRRKAEAFVADYIAGLKKKRAEVRPKFDKDFHPDGIE